MSLVQTDEQQSIKKRTRLLDNDRQKYSQAVQAQLLKQSDAIANLKRENDKLRQELAAMSGGSYSFTEQDRLATMQLECDSLERKIQMERMGKADLEKEHAVERMKMMQTRRSMNGVNVTSENTQLVAKQVHVLENRLDQALVKFNEALAYNRDLRQQIDNLRGERKVFHGIYEKLELELHKRKRDMADVIELSNRDYEERDSYKQQLEALKAAAAEDTKRYEEHFRQLEEMMQQYKAAREQQAQQEALALQQKSQPQRTEEEPREIDTVKSPPKLEATRRDVDQSSTEKEADLQEVVDQLKEATGIQDLDVLYHKFVKAEEHNFSMYNFVNELNSEVELLETEIQQLKEQLRSEKGDVQRRRMLKELENELATVEQQTEAIVDRTAHLKESLDQVRATTQTIFTKIGCSSEAAEEQLGTSECTNLNLLEFLGIIEQRTNEILYAYNLAAANEMKKHLASKGEEVRKRRERRQAERQARIDAGEPVPDDENEDEEEEAEVAEPESADSTEHLKAKFIGVGPAVSHGTVSVIHLVKQQGLPTTNIGDSTAGEVVEDIEDDQVVSHEALRHQAEQNLRQKREKEERVQRKKAKVPPKK